MLHYIAPTLTNPSKRCGLSSKLFDQLVLFLIDMSLLGSVLPVHIHGFPPTAVLESPSNCY